MPPVVEPAGVTPTGYVPGAVPLGNQVFIEIREHWDDPWVWEPELVALVCQQVTGSMGRSELRIARRYGPQHKHPWQGSFGSRAKWENLTGWWVRLVFYIDEQEETQFVGQIEAPVEQVAGDQALDDQGEPQPQGRQEWIAYGPLRLLERCTFSGSLWQYTNGEAYELDWVPDFNLRHGDPGLKGNRSEQMVSDPEWPMPVYTFAGEELWTAEDILDYALQAHVMNRFPGGPSWVSGGDCAYLDSYDPQITMRSVSDVAALLRALIPPARGIEFSLPYFENVQGGEEGFEVYVFGLHGEEIVFEGYFSLDNPFWTELEAGRQRTHEINVERGAVEKYDKLRIVGDRVLTVLSLGNTGSEAGVLWAGWTAAEQAACLAGDTETEDATAQQHDAYRASERFRRVFADFGTPVATFDYGGGTGNPVFNPDGSYDLSDTEFQRFELGTLPLVPLEVGVDYSTDPPSDRNPPGSKVEYLPLLVWCWDPRLERYLLVNKLQQVDPAYPPVEVRALEHELGVLLRASPQHVFAAGLWEGAAASRFDPDAQGFEWSELIITLALETDQRISVEYELPADMQAGDGSVKEVVVPIAQFWWLTAYTVVELGPDGELLRSPGPGVELRNDVNLLRAMIPGAIARLCYERLRATVRQRGFLEPCAEMLGSMLRLSEGEQSELIAETPITSVIWNFEQAATTVLTGQRQR